MASRVAPCREWRAATSFLPLCLHRVSRGWTTHFRSLDTSISVDPFILCATARKTSRRKGTRKRSCVWGTPLSEWHTYWEVYVHSSHFAPSSQLVLSYILGVYVHSSHFAPSSQLVLSFSRGWLPVYSIFFVIRRPQPVHLTQHTVARGRRRLSPWVVVEDAWKIKYLGGSLMPPRPPLTTNLGNHAKVSWEHKSQHSYRLVSNRRPGAHCESMRVRGFFCSMKRMKIVAWWMPNDNSSKPIEILW